MTATRPKGVLLLSGGLDSSVAAFLAPEHCDPVVALTFDYGQQASRRELGAAYRIAEACGVGHRTVHLPFYRQIPGGALLQPDGSLPEPAPTDLDDPAGAADSAGAVWVPNRNGVMIAVAAAWAEAIGASVLVVGFNAEEARTFPDNRAEFVACQNEALAYSTRNAVRVLAPTGTWTKSEIVARAQREDWPLELVWSCYRGDPEPCGRCESCRRFARALAAAGAGAWYRRRLESLRR